MRTRTSSPDPGPEPRPAWRARLARLNEAMDGVGHSILLVILGVALVAGWVVDVERSAANVAIGVGCLGAAVLMALDGFGRLRGRWAHATWAVLAVVTAAFVWINFL